MQNEERIAVLELQYRTMKRIVLGVAWVISLNFAICSLIIVGYFVSTTNAPDVIQAKKFEVVNDEGKVVASFYANMGGGMLSFSNKDGEVVAGLGSDEVNGGGVLGINNKDGKIVAGIFANKDGGVVRVLNNKFTEVVVISASTELGGLLGIHNKDGEQVVTLFANEDGNGMVQTNNGRGEEISVEPSGE